MVGAESMGVTEWVFPKRRIGPNEDMLHTKNRTVMLLNSAGKDEAEALSVL